MVSGQSKKFYVRFIEMLIIPAIDIKDGHCVRLKQGLMQDATVFSEAPADMARHWLEQGAERLHLVDLNGAFAGKPVNEQAIKAIVDEVAGRMPIQLGGGIRDLDTIERYLDDGIDFVIIGTAAVKNPGFLHEACDAFPGQIIVGLDAKDGKVAVDGWSKLTGHDVVDLAKKFEDYGVEAVVYTDIGRDGMLTGVNIEATVTLAQSLRIPVIASGGITDLEDVRRLCAVEPEGIMGAITGRAIYEGTLDFAAARKLAEELNG
jgi:phosphoribosylformimino-5-aminoimidazole carboxamide ribotide isomerase